MKKRTSTGPTICNICKRKKETAIREQLQNGSSCGHANCTFSKEIKTALEGKKKIKILAPLKTQLKIKILPSITPNPDGKQD